jgi:hypothetical protein
MLTPRSVGSKVSSSRRVAHWLAAVTLGFASSPARAHPEKTETETDPDASAVLASDEDEDETPLDDAPLPGEARGVTEPPRHRAEALLWAPRVVAFVPRWVVWGAFTPVRFSLVALQRNRVRERFIDLFFNDARTFGIVPIAQLERFLGVFMGARLVYLDLFGAGGSLSLRTGAGDRLRQFHRLTIDTGSLFGRRTIVRGWIEFRVRPRETFAGIGNPTITSIDDASTLPRRLDATQVHDIGIISRFREDRLEWGLMAEHALTDTLFVQAGHEILRKTFDDAVLMTEPYLTTVYDPSTIPAFETGFLQSYYELAFVYSNLRVSNRWVPAATPSRGWRVRGYHGVAQVLVPGSWYTRTGIDVARFFDLYRGNRVLRLRMKIDLVQGTYDRIPFSELPSLGGAEFLRGYRQDLFRDRLAGLVSAEYFFPIDARISAYSFVDAGRVYSGLEALSVRDLRLGFGGGLQIHNGGLFISRIQLASSLDRELMFQIRFEPTFSMQEYL